jgi:hypothetical protein
MGRVGGFASGRGHGIAAIEAPRARDEATVGTVDSTRGDS